MKKVLCVFLCLGCMLLSTTIAEAKVEFVPELTNFFSWSSDEWFSTEFSRSTFMLIFAEDLSKVMAMKAGELDLFHTYTGIMKDDSLVVWYIMKDESYIFAVYDPFLGKAVADSGELPDVYSNTEKILEETCREYYKNRISDVRDAMEALYAD